MGFLKSEKNALAETIRATQPVGRWKQLRLAISLSVPAIMAQISAIIMQYIDAAMVGSLGPAASASIGLVTTSTWLFMGLCSSAAIGFSVQVAHQLGSDREESARSIFRQSIVATGLFSLLLMCAGLAISRQLPTWLGGSPDINHEASLYFGIFMISLPILQYSFLSSGMLRCSGNMIFPGIAGVVGCVLDVIFNFFLIFPSREIQMAGITVHVPGAGLGVQGAAIGTMAAQGVIVAAMMAQLVFRSPTLSLWRRGGGFIPRRGCMSRAFQIGMPMGVERFLTSGAQVMLTIIVAPLGTFAIAANAFAITAESLCYMPGYGIADAATTLVGQSLGAGKKTLARQFAYTCVGMGVAVMALLGVVMYITAPAIIGLMTPSAEIVELGAMALRTEAWAEPMYAASIVAYGVFVGAGDTLVPCCMNLGCMWIIRISLAAALAPVYGLHGVWIAMCIELCCRGAFFLWRLKSPDWMKRIDKLI